MSRGRSTRPLNRNVPRACGARNTALTSVKRLALRRLPSFASVACSGGQAPATIQPFGERRIRQEEQDERTKS